MEGCKGCVQNPLPAMHAEDSSRDFGGVGTAENPIVRKEQSTEQTKDSHGSR